MIKSPKRDHGSDQGKQVIRNQNGKAQGERSFLRLKNDKKCSPKCSPHGIEASETALGVGFSLSVIFDSHRLHRKERESFNIKGSRLFSFVRDTRIVLKDLRYLFD